MSEGPPNVHTLPGKKESPPKHRSKHRAER
jgi:hypothetical protein